MSGAANGVHAPGRQVSVNGHALWVEEEGNGPPVLLLAGLGPAGSHAVFHPHFQSIADGFGTIYVDLYGRGRSERPSDLREISFDGDVADIAALLDRLGYDAFHLYGFSYGGLIAQALALSHPQRVASLTLANSLHSPEMWQLNHENLNREIAAQLPELWDQIIGLRADGVVSTDPRMQALFGPTAPLMRFYNPDQASRLFTEPGARNPELYRIFCGDDVDFNVGNRILEIPDFRPLLREIRAPMQVIAGRFDRALYPALQRQFQQAAPRAAYLLFERSGSFTHVEEPERLRAVLGAFWTNAGSVSGK